ncbi:MAG: cytochrome c family protein [Planctomycetes bacterium]|nr:cytochrome c family protein [Planctomycetota bacterium]
MKTAISISVGVLLIGTWVAVAAAPRPGGERVAAVAAVRSAGLAPIGVEEPKYTYVGSKKCKMCHTDEHKSWAKTKMGQAFAVLQPDHSKEAKERFKLDPAKDYSRDSACLKCHTTAFGEAGGYFIPDPEDKKSARAAKKLEHVGCESCHGPGSEYIKVFMDILMSKRKYKVEELYAVGLEKITEATCAACHNEESMKIHPGEAFDYEKRKAEGIHDHQPMKQREG